jgi:3-deoxy-D-manno-octulosonic-acid transferase
MIHRLYSLAVFALLPWALLHLWWRGRRQPAYRRHWGERFGRYALPPPGPPIWIHAVSVGETRAAQPLVAALRRRYPDAGILFTHMTPTGRQTSLDLFGNQVAQVYLPYDTPRAVGRFLDHFRPRLGLIMETELWPNLIAACHERGLPLLLVNARLSARSARRYGRVPTLTHQALGQLAAIAAQADDDAKRLQALGAPTVEVLGNLKFDIEPPADQASLGREFRGRLGSRPVCLCASTREGEESLILEAWQAAAPEALLVIVPRHPQRFDEVAELVRTRGLALQRRSDGQAVTPATRVWLGDSMGEMFAYYGACDLAFVGGSLLDYGSQNLIEPCAVGVPVLLGPSTFNFAEAARAALAAGAARQVVDAADLVAAFQSLLGDPESRHRMAAAGLDFARRHRGATDRSLALIGRFLPAPD